MVAYHSAWGDGLGLVLEVEYGRRDGGTGVAIRALMLVEKKTDRRVVMSKDVT